MEINKISTDTQKSMKTRIITGAILACVGIPVIILGDWLFIAGIIFLAAVSVWEILKVTGKKYPWPIYVIMYIFTFSFTFWTFFQAKSQNVYPTAWYDHELFRFSMIDIRISTMGVGFLIALLFAYSIVSEKVDTHDVFYLFSMSLFIGISLQSVMFLRFSPQALPQSVDGTFEYGSYLQTCLLLFYILGGTALNDTFAYFVGVLFGKHKMNPRVSPKKTWEGFFGGIILSAICTSTFALVSDGVFNVPLLKGVIDIEHWYFVILISLCLGFFSVLGDLMFSLIKRSYNIKDFGTIFPGHGGVLDRFDSLLITSLLTTILITYIFYSPILGVIA